VIFGRIPSGGRSPARPLEPVLGRLSLFRDNLYFIQNHPAPSLWKISNFFESRTITTTGDLPDLHLSFLERLNSGKEPEMISRQGIVLIPGTSFRAERLDFQTWRAIL
jgi:hypothetical protein